jgi:hypothetical protein
MSTLSSLSFLRRVLVADAAISGTTGLLLFAAASPLASLLGLPEVLLRYAGLSLIPFAAAVLYLARSQEPSRGAVWSIIALNVLWAADSVLLLMTNWVSPGALGYAFVIAQALIVALLGELQYVGLRRTTTA